jgi:uncharacterized protein YigA (DUF484 family)
MTQAEQSTTSLTTPDQDSLSEEEVVRFLTNNVDFFQRFPDVLETLNIPHEKGSAISLVERQINLLREKNQALEGQLNSLISVAHDNNNTQKQIHQLVIEVLAAEDAETALHILTDKLAQDFDVDHVAIRLFADKVYTLDHIDQAWVLTSQSARETLDDFTPSNEPLCGRLKAGQLKRLFGEHADSIASSVIIPLRRKTLHGIIAFGSVDEHRFNPGMDTLYLKRLGELIAAALLRLIH